MGVVMEPSKEEDDFIKLGAELSPAEFIKLGQLLEEHTELVTKPVGELKELLKDLPEPAPLEEE